jgi:hypothetical protein
MFRKIAVVLFFPALVLGGAVILGLAGAIYVAVVLVAELREADPVRLAVGE